MRRGRIEPPSARPVALRSSAFLSLRAALIGPAAILRREPFRRQFGSSPCRVYSGMGRRRDAIGRSQRAPRTGIVVSPGRCPEASREWIVTPPAGADLIPPTAHLRMAAPRGRGGPRIEAARERGDKFAGEVATAPSFSRMGEGGAERRMRVCAFRRRRGGRVVPWREAAVPHPCPSPIRERGFPRLASEPRTPPMS